MSEKITITFPDGNKKEVDKGISGLDLASQISKSLAKESVAVKINDEIKDISLPINTDVSVAILKKDSEEALELIRHDCAHVMAEAVQELFPGTQVTIGPAIENGFYYDFARNEPFTLSVLPKIEKKMHEIIQRNESFVREVWSKDEAIKYFKDKGENYKVELINDLSDNEEISIYKQGGWLDLCRGPHMISTKQIGKAFKLMKVAGAYWRGDSSNAMLTRIYGTAWRLRKILNNIYYKLKKQKKEITVNLEKKWIYFTFKKKLRELYFGILKDGSYFNL